MQITAFDSYFRCAISEAKGAIQCQQFAYSNANFEEYRRWSSKLAPEQMSKNSFEFTAEIALVAFEFFRSANGC